jgi:hypothetical protein
VGVQIKIEGNPVTTADGDVRGNISATQVEPRSTEPRPGPVEVRVEASDGTASVIRLSTVEAEMFALVLGKIVDDCRLRGEDPEAAENDDWDGRSITRDQLIKQLLPLPRDAAIDVQLFHEHIALFGLGHKRSPEENRYPLEASAVALGEVLMTWGLPEAQVVRALRGDR